MSYFGLLFTFIFSQNVILYYFFGLSSLEEKSSQSFTLLLRDGGILMGMCALAATLTRTFYLSILVPLDLAYLKTFLSMGIILILAKLGEYILRRYALVDNWERLLVNSVVFGVALLVIEGQYTFLESLISGVAAGAGYIIAIGLLSILREQFVIEGVPRKMQGAPILFISAGLIAMAFFAIDTALITRLWE